MSKQNQFSSTEKLLELIRESHTPLKGPALDTPRPRKPARRRLFSFGRGSTIGVEVGYGMIRLVKIRHISEQHRRIDMHENIPLDFSPDEKGNAFSQLLKSRLRHFANGSNPEIWALANIDRVDMERLVVPKVPRKRLDQVIYWTYTKKRKGFDENSRIMDYQVCGEVVENGVPKIEVLVSALPRRDVDMFRSLFLQAGYPLTGFSIYSYALQNIIRSCEALRPGSNLCCMHIGMDRTRFDIFSDSGHLILSRQVKASMSSMIDAVEESLGENLRGGRSANVARAGHAPPPSNRSGEPSEAGETEGTADSGEADGGVYPSSSANAPSSLSRSVFFAFINGEFPIRDQKTGTIHHFSDDEMIDMISPALDRLVWQIERTFQWYTNKTGKGDIPLIYVQGDLGDCKPLTGYIERKLNLPVQVKPLDPFSTGIREDEEMCLYIDSTDRKRMIPALGMAMSRNHITPNFLFTYREKQRKSTLAVLNRGVFIAFVLLACLVFGAYYWQEKRLAEMRTDIRVREQRLEQLISVHGIRLNRQIIDAYFPRIERIYKQAKAYARNHLSVPAIGMILEKTPENVELVQLEYKNRGNPPSGENALLRDPRGTSEETVSTETPGAYMILSARILETSGTFQQTLIEYFNSLKESELVRRVTVMDRGEEEGEGRRVFRFTLRVDFKGA